jgi:PBS lyase HEAT-like repeat
MIARIVVESHALGKDHEVVLEAVAALGSVGSDAAIPTLTAVIQRGGFFGRRKLRALKTTGVAALSQIGGPHAMAALEQARRTGDRMLKKVVANHR